MEWSASAASGVERRADERADCDIAARIEFAGGQIIGCRIKDLSSGGFKLEVVEMPDVPDAFDLLIPVVDGIVERRRAEVAWREANLIGARFV